MKNKKLITATAAAILYLSAATFPAWAAGNWQQDAQGKWKYEENGAIAQDKWVNVTDGRCYVDENGYRKENEWFSIASVPTEPKDKIRYTWYYAGSDGKIYINGWYTIDGHDYYFGKGGNCTLDGIITVDDKKYYISKDNGCMSGGWFHIDRTNDQGVSYSTWYYASADRSLYCNGWFDIDGGSFYFYEWGNAPRNAWVNLDEKRYYIGEKGLEKNGWFSVSGINKNGDEYTNWYYAEADGDIRRAGFSQIGEDTYYFDQNGLSFRARWFSDDEKNRYYLNADGKVEKGWFNVPTVNKDGANVDHWYYGGEDGKVLKDGYHDLDGKTYYFDQNGLRYQSRWINLKNGKRQYFDENGVMQKSCWFSLDKTKADGTPYTEWYYADENGYRLNRGIYTIDGKRYFINNNGTMFTGWYTMKTGDRYYCGEDGAVATGWQMLKIPVDWDANGIVGRYVKANGRDAYFYFDETTGVLTRSLSGNYTEINVNGTYYCVDKRGIMQRGWGKLRDTSPEIDGFRYYMPEATDTLAQGERARDCWVKTLGADDMVGELTENWYRFDSNGMAVRAGRNEIVLKEFDGKTYAFDENGRTLDGFWEINRVTYYFNMDDKNAAATGKIQIDDGNGVTDYYFTETGSAYTGVYDGSLYYKGRMQKAFSGKGYEAISIPDGSTKLVDEAGKIVVGQTVTDADGNEWTTDDKGAITKNGSQDRRTAFAPSVRAWQKGDDRD